MNISKDTIHVDKQTVDQLKQDSQLFYDDKKKPKPEIVSGGQALINFLKSLKIGADLAGSLAPVFSLKHYSFLEWLSRLMQPRPYMMNIATVDSPEKRMLIMLKYAVEAVSTMIQEGVQEIKPYNPILGEVFICKWPSPEGDTEFVSEQVSHHPPISTCYFNNEKKGFKCQMTFQPKVKLQAGGLNVLKGPIVNSSLEGLQIFSIPSLGEDYEISFPNYVCRNLFYGGTYTELNNDLTVTCKKSGLTATMTFKSKSKHKCSGYIRRGKEKLYKLQGISNSKIVTTKLADKKTTILSNIEAMKRDVPVVKPVHEQEVHESRRVWNCVTKNIFKKNLQEANAQKTVIENAQREIRKKRKEMGVELPPRLFTKVTKGGKAVMLGPKTPMYRYNKY